MKKIIVSLATILVATSMLTACTNRQVGTIGGATLGGLAGYGLSGGSGWGAAAGAVGGGLVGYAVTR